MRAITIATEAGHKPVKGADHKRPVYHYKLTPGTAWKINDDTREHEVVEVDAKTCDKAGYTFTLRWIDGRTVAVFDTGHAQPISEDARAKPKAPKIKKLPGVKPPVLPAIEEPKPEPIVKTQVKKPKPEKKAKGLRKKGYGLDL